MLNLNNMIIFDNFKITNILNYLIQMKMELLLNFHNYVNLSIIKFIYLLI